MCFFIKYSGNLKNHVPDKQKNMLKRNNIIKIISGIFAYIFLWWSQNLLNLLFDKFNPYLIEKSANPLLRVFIVITSILLTKIPLYLILLFFLLVWFIYKIITLIIKPRNFKIIKAIYGSKNGERNITNDLNGLVIDNKLDITLSNSICGFDPAPHTIKTCTITYQVEKKVYTKKYKEGEKIKLP